MSFVLQPVDYVSSTTRRKTLFALLASGHLLLRSKLAGCMNVLPQLLSIEPVAPTFGKIRLYYGTQRVLCEADDQIWPRTDPAFRLFHNILFEGEQMDTWVAHADFCKHPEFELFYPEASDRRRLHFLNR